LNASEPGRVHAREISARRYVGIQIELNQKFPRGDERRWRRLRGVLRASFIDAFDDAR
jgi:hypothetical protein